MKVDLFKANISDAQKKYLSKDQTKCTLATKFIGRGNGATGEYLRLISEAGYPCNCGEYDKDDIVFVSVNGKRKGRMPLDVNEVMLAIKARASIVADAKNRRPEGGNPYNIGEQELADLLREQGYTECISKFHSDISVWIMK